jgi:hypothetical protein
VRAAGCLPAMVSGHVHAGALRAPLGLGEEGAGGGEDAEDEFLEEVVLVAA